MGKLLVGHRRRQQYGFLAGGCERGIMEPYYKITPGECLSSLTEACGFSSYHTIWDHPNNAGLRERRSNSNVLCPGDEVYIPERESKAVDGCTCARHTFVLSMPEVMLRMVVQDQDGKPITSAHYRLTAGAKKFEGVTGGDGIFEHPIAPDLQSGTLDFIYRKPNGVMVQCSWILKLGHLDDVATPSGIQARLKNLGFDSGDVDGVIGPKTEVAIRRFQKWAGLNVDGVAGPKTQTKLKTSHGC
jgi:hypothetical protein